MKTANRYTAVAVLFCVAAAQAASAARCIGTFEMGSSPITVTLGNLQRAAAQAEATRCTRQVEVIALVNDSLSSRQLARYGWRIVSRIGEVATLSGNAAPAPYLCALPGIRFVQFSSRVRPQMDSARKLTFVDQVHGTRPGGIGRRLSGKKVLIGVIDTEFDTHHTAFLDSNGATRFVALWDQADTTRGSPNRFGYGVIKNHSQLLNDTVFGLRNNEFHGTFMTSFAASSDYRSPYYGVAPDAMLAGVKINDSTSSLVDGLAWLDSLADSLKVPCVINMSLGIADGPHDGTSLVDRAIDNIANTPGHIVVGAAGNDGDKQAHATFQAASGASKGAWITPEVYPLPNGRQQVESAVDLWGEAGKTVAVSLYILDTTKMVFRQSASAISTFRSTRYGPQRIFWYDSATGRYDTVTLWAITQRASSLNGKPHILAGMSSFNPVLYLGVQVSVTGGGTVQSWNLSKKALRSFNIAGYYDGDTVMSVNELGGTAKRNITVGAYGSKLLLKFWDGRTKDWGEDPANPHKLTLYTSHGPTVDGRIKPDITAPGSDVAGAVPRNMTDNSSTVFWPDTHSLAGRYATTGGTSVAAPVAAGIIALMLEANPALSVEQVRQILQETAITDIATGPITMSTLSNKWGAGKINALGAVAKVLGVNASDRPLIAAEPPPAGGLVELAGNRLRFLVHGNGKSMPVDIEVFSMNGRRVMHLFPVANGAIVSITNLPHGVYLVRACRGGASLATTKIGIVK